jgi:hypothetical protein
MKSIYLLFLAALYLACNQGSNQQEAKSEQDSEIKNHSEILERGGELSMQAQTKLSSALMKAVQDSGINHALQFCSMKALDLTQSAGKEGVEISRVSHRPRNRLNAANEEELNIIERYEKLVAQNAEPKPQVVEKSDHFIYYSPILIPANLCLNCHGKPGVDIAEENFITIQMLYPEDKAVDFELGDLRGMWKIKFDKEVI